MKAKESEALGNNRSLEIINNKKTTEWFEVKAKESEAIGNNK